MSKSRWLWIPGLLVAATIATSFQPRPASSDETKPPSRTTGKSLLGILAEWKYPDSKMLAGASMSDGGHLSVKCEAVLTTTDSVEKVAEFYAKKAAKPAAKADVNKGLARPEDFDHRVLANQDDSKGRPMALRIVSIHQHKSSTTLVISRATGEKETHIAWSHFYRYGAE